MSRVLDWGFLRHHQQRLRVRSVSIFGVFEDIPHCSRASKNLRPLVERSRKLLCVGLKLEMLVPEPLTGGKSTYVAPPEAQPRIWLAQRVALLVKPLQPLSGESIGARVTACSVRQQDLNLDVAGKRGESEIITEADGALEL